MLLISWQSSAQWRQVLAQLCTMESDILPQAFAQISHRAAQALHVWVWWGEPLVIKAALVWQISLQSHKSRMSSRVAWSPALERQWMACRQTIAQSVQASMQSLRSLAASGSLDY